MSYQPTILYIHGYNSSGQAEKALVLKDNFPSVFSETYDFKNPDMAFLQLNNFIKRHMNSSKVIIVGSSLGGFWARYFGLKYLCKTVLINPSLTPSISLQKYVPEEQSIDQIQSYLKYEFEINYEFQKVNDFMHTWILLGGKDDRIDHLATYISMRQNPFNHFIIYGDETHRIEDKMKVVSIVREALIF